MNWRALVKLLGMGRVLEALLSIVSFACTVNFHGMVPYTVACSNGDHPPLSVEWRYPFWLSSIMVDSDLCNHTFPFTPSPSEKGEQLFFVDFAIQAQFFVFVGVCSFLVSLVSAGVYVFLWRAYTLDTVLPTVDFIASIVMALLWLSADCSWASAYGSMSMYLQKDQISQSVNALPFCQGQNKCTAGERKEEFGNGGFGLTMGFVNCIIWVLNAFLAYKEQQKIKFEKDRLMYTADAFRAQSTPTETMDATSINARGGFQAI